MAMAVVYTRFAGQIVSENRGGVTREYLSDPLGSTIALASSSAITDTWDYWPYGEVMSRTGTNPTPFTFVGTLGYFKDLLDKLFYVRARHYQPNYGRWLTVDPLWPDERPYGYANGTPVSSVDITGMAVDWRECIKNCLKVFAGAFMAALANCVYTTGWLCKLCLATLVAGCIFAPEFCIAQIRLCISACGRNIVGCLLRALATALAVLAACLAACIGSDCFDEGFDRVSPPKERPTPEPTVVHE